MILELLFFVLAVAITVRSLSNLTHRSTKAVAAKRKNPQIVQLLGYAQRLYSERKYLAAEKAFMEVLKHEHRNTNAYSHLARIYMALKNYDDAIECAQILAQLEPNAHNFFGLGSIYFDNHNYIKAIAGFEKAIMFEPSAGRYAALARSYQKLSNHTKAVAALEKAVELDSDVRNLQLLAEAYLAGSDRDKAIEVYRRVLEASPNDRQARSVLAQAAASLEKAPA